MERSSFFGLYESRNKEKTKEEEGRKKVSEQEEGRERDEEEKNDIRRPMVYGTSSRESKNHSSDLRAEILK